MRPRIVDGGVGERAETSASRATAAYADVDQEVKPRLPFPLLPVLLSLIVRSFAGRTHALLRGRQGKVLKVPLSPSSSILEDLQGRRTSTQEKTD